MTTENGSGAFARTAPSIVTMTRPASGNVHTTTAECTWKSSNEFDEPVLFPVYVKIGYIIGIKRIIFPALLVIKYVCHCLERSFIAGIHYRIRR